MEGALGIEGSALGLVSVAVALWPNNHDGDGFALAETAANTDTLVRLAVRSLNLELWPHINYHVSSMLQPAQLLVVGTAMTAL